MKEAVAPPVATLAVVGETTTTIAGAAVIEMVAPADLVPSATEVAVSATVPEGTDAGAVYVIGAPEALDELETLPHAAPLQPAPDSAQVTPLFALSFVTVAVKVVVPLTGTVAVAWERVTAIVAAGAAVIVIVTVADFVPSATEVALSVTFDGLGTAGGVVYVTVAPEALELAERVPHVAPLHPAPASIQLTPLALLSFATVAVNVAACPVCTEAVVGEMVTEIEGVAGVGVGAATGVLAEPPPHPAMRSVAARRGRTGSRRTRRIRRTKFILPHKGKKGEQRRGL